MSEGKTLEQRLRKTHVISGTPVELNIDGRIEEWLIPSMPVTCDFEEVDGKLTASMRNKSETCQGLIELAEKIQQDETADASDVFVFMYRVMELNYELTPEIAKGLFELDQFDQFVQGLFDAKKKVTWNGTTSEDG